MENSDLGDDDFELESGAATSDDVDNKENFDPVEDDLELQVMTRTHFGEL